MAALVRSAVAHDVELLLIQAEVGIVIASHLGRLCGVRFESAELTSRTSASTPSAECIEP